MNEELVWYAAYGSNLSRDRFMCYIEGGTPPGSTKDHTGCSDRSPPMEDRTVLLPYGLLFSMRSAQWEDAGVAFVDPENLTPAGTLGRMYLVTGDQFVQIVRQENGLDPDDASLDIDLDLAIREGELELPGPYGRLIHVGFEMPRPIFTFTSPTAADLELRAPGERYLTTIIKGLIETYDMSDDEISLYLKSANGIHGTPVERDLDRVIAEARSDRNGT